MVKHIVMWTLKDSANGKSKLENLEEMKRQIEELPSLITEIEFSVELGKNYTVSDRSFDLCLISDFKSEAELAIYRTHPIHVKVVEFAKTVVEKSALVDYEY